MKKHDVLLVERVENSLHPIKNALTALTKNAKLIWEINYASTNYENLKKHSEHKKELIICLEYSQSVNFTEIFKNLISEKRKVIVVGNRENILNLQELISVGAIGYIINEENYIELLSNFLLREQFVQTNQNYSYRVPLNKSIEPNFYHKATPTMNETPIKTCSVLVVDDHEINRLVLSKMLEKLSATVDLASSGKEAIEATNRKFYSIIFMDIMMPEMDGIECTRIIRNNQMILKRKSIIIATTAAQTEEEIAYFLKQEMDDFLGKPIAKSKLTDIFHKHSRTVNETQATA